MVPGIIDRLVAFFVLGREWDYHFSMTSLPGSIAEWSELPPPEQWGKSSPARKYQSAKIEKTFAQGQDFMTYFKDELNESQSVYQKHNG
ncbi:hypothetical protein [Pseudomonas zeae]|uniref:Transposase n=1 Tax=Pseudomonas zeae TaxID=2745510 RepID=A0ABU5BQA6_9PSED|nr:hypothetical protein [Pseudomonas zeae]MDX9678364.1 hypothetical protein [Pseudomonas zeae]